MDIHFISVYGKTTSKGQPVLACGPLPVGAQGAYVSNGHIWLYGHATQTDMATSTAKGDLSEMIAAAVAEALAKQAK